jgi:hypothetical protein
MKKNVILTAIISLFLGAATISAQQKTIDFSGNWELDAGKSKLGRQTRVESITMIVSQTGKELKVETKTKHAFTPEAETRGGEKKGGEMIRTNVGGNFGDTTQTVSYNLDGVETKSEIPGIPNATTVFKAKFENDGKLHLFSSRALETPKGVTAAVKEIWTLSADGKTLTIVREQEMPGKSSAELVFNKK